MGDKDIIIRSAGPVSKHIYDNQIDRIIQLCLVNDIHVIHVKMQGSTRVPGVTREVVKLYGVCMNELKVCILPTTLSISQWESVLVVSGHENEYYLIIWKNIVLSIYL